MKKGLALIWVSVLSVLLLPMLSSVANAAREEGDIDEDGVSGVAYYKIPGSQEWSSFEIGSRT